MVRTRDANGRQQTEKTSSNSNNSDLLCAPYSQTDNSDL